MNRLFCLFPLLIFVLFSCNDNGTSFVDGDEENVDSDVEFSDFEEENNSDKCPEDRLFLSIKDAKNKTPDEYFALIKHQNERFSVYCNNRAKTSGKVACRETGLLLQGFENEMGVLLKAKGYQLVKKQIDIEKNAEEKTSEFECTNIKISLDSLPQFESNEDYVTGFNQVDGVQKFTSMSVLTPTEIGKAYTIKFYIDEIKETPKIYFQNTKKHPLHYGFVSGILGKNFSRQEYERRTYHGEDREAMAGTIVYYPELKLNDSNTLSEYSSPFTIEFFPSDDLTPEQALLAFQAIEENMLFIQLAGKEHRLFYVPPTEAHQKVLEKQEVIFLNNAASWIKREDLYGNIEMQLLNHGLAFGTLRYFTPDELSNAPVSYKDIAVLSRLPNEVPLLGGTITEELQTPLAHVNVAARSRGTPNMALLKASEHEQIQPLINSLVRFEVSFDGFKIKKATIEDAEIFWKTLIPEQTTFPLFDIGVSGLLDFDSIGFNDSNTVGEKAANLSELQDILGDKAPNGFAVPFHFYNNFMTSSYIESTQCGTSYDLCMTQQRTINSCQKSKEVCEKNGVGKSLQDYINFMIEDEELKSDSVFRATCLDGFRNMIHEMPVEKSFSEMLDAKVEKTFGRRRIRLRSSTNAEDLENFSGAGLYRSISAEIGKDAPSSRIKKVWASVWNWRAFEERSFCAIDHSSVKMGVAVHVAYQNEVANGVLITRNLADPAVDGYYVNVQFGEWSVTNPEEGVLPESFSIVRTSEGLNVVRTRYSSLANDSPVLTKIEIENLYKTANKIQQHFSDLYNKNPYEFALDMEFKIIGSERKLIVKQTRPYFERN